jgi:hypothetical protein
MKLCVLLTLLMTSVSISSVTAVEPTADENRKALPSVTRVRTPDMRVKAALAEGQKRSASFRSVLKRVEELDVIVYVEMQPLLPKRLAGATTWITATKIFRYVRVSLNPALSKFQMVAALAHELQHVAEIGGAPSIVDIRTLTDYYREVGIDKHLPSDEWETEAAKVTGQLVRHELAASASLPSEPASETGPANGREERLPADAFAREHF